jgi:hypothetical protein
MVFHVYDKNMKATSGGQYMYAMMDETFDES